MSEKITPKEDAQPAGTVSRREFMLRVGNTAVGVTMVGGGIVTGKFLWPNVVPEPQSRFRVGSVEAFAPGSCITDSKHRLFVFRAPEGYFYAVSAVCTHLGCTVAWKPDGTEGRPEGVIACPCHGSVFSSKGEVIEGPAPRSLNRFRMTMIDGELFVDTNEIVDGDDTILRV
jgi:cytochrome b6-f complex iron-sulfur subunit